MEERVKPKPSNVLGVFGLSIYTRERDIEDLFRKYGHIERVQILYDRAVSVAAATRLCRRPCRTQPHWPLADGPIARLWLCDRLIA